MGRIETFRAINCAGSIIPDPEAVTAMCLLFEKVYLPNDLEIVAEFARHFDIKGVPGANIRITFEGQSVPADDPFSELSPHERLTADRYFAGTVEFIEAYMPLFRDVFESPCFPDGSPLEVKLIEKGAPGELNKYRVSRRACMEFRSESSEEVSNLISEGYIPLVTKYAPTSFFDKVLDTQTSSQIATLLAMETMKLVLPRTRAASANTILEARDRLKDHLPPFWAAMFKLSRTLREQIDDGATSKTLRAEARNLADETVRPALIELKQKMNLERKQWFYRILSPIQKGLRLIVGNPPLTQQQLITSAMILGSDVAMAGASHLQQIEALKNSTGLTMLLEAEQVFDNDNCW